jgi:hypothetical protein
VATEGAGQDRDVDQEFARIVSGWDDVATTSGSATLTPPVRMPVAPDDGPGPDEAAATRAGGGDPTGLRDAEGDALGEQAPGGDAPRGDEPGGDAPDRAGPGALGGEGPAYRTASDPDTQAWRGYLPDEPDEHFEPPEPQLPPPHDATYWLAVLGLVAGPLLVLWAVVLSGDPDPGWLILAGLLLTVGGFGLLVMRGSGERDPGDDGSRV